METFLDAVSEVVSKRQQLTLDPVASILSVLIILVYALLRLTGHRKSRRQQIAEMEESFTRSGIKTEVFRSHLLHQFVLCMWTARRRQALLEHARDFDAVVVMGCEAAVATVRSTLESTSCRVISGMRSEGIMSIQPKFSLPCTVRLELESITPYVYPEGEDAAAEQM